MQQTYLLAVFLFFNWFAFSHSLIENFFLEATSPGVGFTEQLKNQIQKKHVVFVKGLMHEVVPFNYLTDNVHELQDLGITHTVIRPSSRHSFVDNASALVPKLKKISHIQKKPIILIGHSKGGSDVLYMILKNPELITSGVIERVVILQAPLGGSPLADGFLKSRVAGPVRPIISQAITCMFPELSKWLFKKALVEFENQIMPRIFSSISDKVFYVRAAHHSDQKGPSFGLQFYKSVLKDGLLDGRENDGLVFTNDHLLAIKPKTMDERGNEFELFGIDLGIFEADHTDFVMSGFFTNTPKFYRTAFTRAILQTIYQDPKELKADKYPWTYWE